MINLVLGFWGVCMWVNYQSTQPAAKDLSKVNTEQRYFYLGLLGTSGFFIFLNNIVVKYNSDNYCRSTDNYNILYEYVESQSDSNARYSDSIHILMTLLYILCYVVAFFILGDLGNVYNQKRKLLVSRKLKQD